MRQSLRYTITSRLALTALYANLVLAALCCLPAGNSFALLCTTTGIERVAAGDSTPAQSPAAHCQLCATLCAPMLAAAVLLLLGMGFRPAMRQGLAIRQPAHHRRPTSFFSRAPPLAGVVLA